MYKVWTDGSLNGMEVVRRTEVLEDGGYDYETIPEQPLFEGRKSATLLRDSKSGYLVWEAVEREPTPEERVKDLEQQLAEETAKRELMQSAIDDLIMNGSGF